MAIGPLSGAIYASQIRITFEGSAGGNQIASPSGRSGDGAAAFGLDSALGNQVKTAILSDRVATSIH
jgi:hypothetical protein